MLSIQNELITLTCTEDGQNLSIVDSITREEWTLDRDRLVYGSVDQAEGRKAELKPMVPASATLQSADSLVITYQAGDHPIRMIYTLLPDCLEVVMPADVSAEIGLVSFPGSFNPTSGSKKYILPVMQGMLWDGRGEPFETRFHEAGHSGFSMAMFGILAENGGLLFAGETTDDCLWWVGKDQSAKTWATNLQVDSLGTMRYDRRIRLYFTQPNITDLAKTYRRRIIERGRFISWEEKIKDRPALNRLFGTIMCFIGYCQDDLDYVAECKKLKAMGFNQALLYAVRFNTYSKDFQMGGFPPIYLDKQTIQEIKDIGYDVAPWSWLNEGLDDGSEDMRSRYRRNRQGELMPGWQIDDQKWFFCCTGSMADYENQANADEFADMTWDHFDVITCATNSECHALDHQSHPGRPLSKSEDRELIRKLLIAGRAGSRPVSSENFNDAYSKEYDLGSVKAWAQYGPWPFWPIPLTMLVFHDSIMHTWWEPHNYNSRFFARDTKKYQYGGGKTRLMSTMDALYGCPPDVFPFGAMYGWTGRDHETFLYRFRLEDKDTQFALEQALPVARLHERTGMLEMTRFDFLTEDGQVQKTVFADGTHVYANFSCNPAYIDSIGSIQSESWLALDQDNNPLSW